ncbi:MAG: HD-GYP domain-containing protein [Planctomycetes bacterium]|nr:HD-GYP domain-containing protein [Planctomycetota bacterium]
MTTVTAEPQTISDFIAIPLSTIIPSKSIGVSLYINQGGEGLKLYRGPDFPFCEEDLQHLVEKGVHQLYVPTDDQRQYQDYLRSNLPDVLNDESIPVQQRFKTLNEVVRDVLHGVFETGDIQKTVEETTEIGRYTVDLVCRKEFAAADLVDILYHDFHTFTHSANVSYYAVVLAKSLGISDKGELNAIAVGALLHDLGKLEIDESILTKPGKLDRDEFEIIKQHPTTGFRKLCHRTDLSYGQLMMVYQHHERMDGSGYPVGLVGSDMHEWARLCAVVDVFEAMTSDRPYRQGMKTSQALAIMERQPGREFDEEMYQCWKATIKNG